MSGVWAAYRDVYESVHATADSDKLLGQLFNIGAAIADKDFSLATSLTEELRKQTVQPGKITLGWGPTLNTDQLLYELRELS